MHQPTPRSAPGRRAVRVLLPLLALLGAAPLSAQPTTQAPVETRDRLGLGYLRLELALRETAGPESRARLNRAFDAVTLQFFAGRFDDALRGLDAMVAGLGVDGEALAARAMRMLEALNAERRAARIGGAEVLYLVHLPAGERPAGGWPVVVAVHGAGGDERMFFGGYGAGTIRDLADRHGLAVLTPRAPLAPESVLGLVDAVAAEHGLDATRVGLLGHSMGAGIVGRTAAAHPARVRAVACIAGACGAASGAEAAAAPPMLLVAGVLDPIFRVDALVGQAETQRQAGRTVEIRRMEEEGHTLIVGEALPGAIAWMAARLGG
jgi:predicted esterase